MSVYVSQFMCLTVNCVLDGLRSLISYDNVCASCLDQHTKEKKNIELNIFFEVINNKMIM